VLAKSLSHFAQWETLFVSSSRCAKSLCMTLCKVKCERLVVSTLRSVMSEEALTRCALFEGVISLIV